MRAAATALALIIGATVAGCAIRHYADLDLIEGHLQTPEGNVPFEKVSRSDYKTLFEPLFYDHQTHLRHAMIVAETASVRVLYCVACPNFNFMISTSDEGGGWVISTEGYEVETESGLTGGPRNDLKDLGYDEGLLLYEDRDGTPYRGVTLPVNGPTYRPESAGQTARARIPFRLNERDFVAEFTVQFKRGSRLVESTGVPAMP